MNSSISSSKLSSRFMVFAIAAAILVAVTRTDIQFARAPDWYWRMKVEWTDRADIVLAGDSRVYRGLDPDIFEQALPELRAVNFGFSSTNWSKGYFDRIDQVLGKNGGAKWIVLGVSPNSLRRTTYMSGTKFEDNGFGSALRDSTESRLSVAFMRNLDAVLYGLRPFNMDYWWAAKTGTASEFALVPDDQYLQRFELSGWVASDFVERDPQRHTNSSTGDRHPSKIDNGTYSELLAAIRIWTKDGKNVIAFRPPVSAATFELETTETGYPEQSIAEDMARAGAIWIDLDIKDYISYDGSHIEAGSARKLSRQLAEIMAAKY